MKSNEVFPTFNFNNIFVKDIRKNHNFIIESSIDLEGIRICFKEKEISVDKEGLKKIIKYFEEIIRKEKIISKIAFDEHNDTKIDIPF